MENFLHNVEARRQEQSFGVVHTGAGALVIH